ncbi:MAG TPA: hypothetical protein VM487_19925 [Phycisphaerae bacterium]|nr:hypothetical protein [Phycisphaerae bacterium]
MISPEKIERVKAMLDEGRFSRRRIVALTCVSRCTVDAIAAGRRPDYEKRRQVRKAEDARLPRGPVRRCPVCRGLTELVDCLVCEVLQNEPAATVDIDGSPDLELRGEHKELYEQVHAARMMGGR